MLFLTGCTASGGARGLRAADAVGHFGGLAERFPGADAELHEQIKKLEEADPDADLGTGSWVAILGSIVGSVLMGGVALDRKRSKSRAAQLLALGQTRHVPFDRGHNT